MDEYEKELLNWLKKASPEQWHEVVMSWNWDNDVDVLRWMIEQPQCDKGTALMIYWMGGAAHSLHFHSRDDIDHEWDRVRYDLLMEIESRCLQGFYQNETFAFDPSNDTSTGNQDDWTEDYNPLPEHRQIPEEMFTPIQGKQVPHVYHPEGIPDEVAEIVEKSQSD